MTNERAAEIMKIERKCVKRQGTPKCDRKCQNCDLLVNTADVIEAYDKAIVALAVANEMPNNVGALFNKLYNGGY